MPLLGEFAGDVGKGLLTVAWKDEGLLSGINNGEKVLGRELDLLCEYYAPQIEGWMRTNAPWTDRTGNARNGLGARAYSSREEHGIVLFHQVPYGIYLETRFSGRYGIVVPALEEWGGRVMEGARGLLTTMGR